MNTQLRFEELAGWSDDDWAVLFAHRPDLKQRLSAALAAPKEAGDGDADVQFAVTLDSQANIAKLKGDEYTSYFLSEAAERIRRLAAPSKEAAAPQAEQQGVGSRINARFKRAEEQGSGGVPDGPQGDESPQHTNEDTELLNWLALHPRGAEMVIDGKKQPCVFWGVSAAPNITLREAIAAAKAKEP